MNGLRGEFLDCSTRAVRLQSTGSQGSVSRVNPCYIGSMPPEFIAILVAIVAGWISLDGLVLRLGGRIDRVEIRLAAVEKETARIDGLLEGLGLTQRIPTTEP